MSQNNPLLDALTREGVLVHVSVRYWRATKKLKPEDLGLNPDDVTERFISLGHKRLLPRDRLEAFAVIESRAHALVEANTFPFLGALGHFLPNARLGEVTSRLNELQSEFGRATTSFLERYADLRQEAAAGWYQAARLLVSDPERVVAVVEASFPEPGAMARAFGFEVQVFQVRAPECLDLALVSAKDQEAVVRAREQAAQGAADQIHRGAERFVADCVAALRQQTAQLCEEMLETIRTGKTGVHQKTLNRLVRFIDQFKSLNFVGDHEMAAQLDRVRQEFLQRTAEDYRDDATARQRLEQGLQALAGTARDLAQQDARELVERFGQVGQRRLILAA
jgi:hypothetical protein